MKTRISSRFILSVTVMLAFSVAMLFLMFSIVRVGAWPGGGSYLDPTFGQGGRALIPITGTNQIARDVVMQPDGKLIIAGYDKWQTNDYDAIMARVHPDGRLDERFGVGGVVTTALTSANDTIYAVALQSDGKIVAVGFTTVEGKSVASVMRYHADGRLDTGFGHQGVLTVSVPSESSFFLSVAVLEDDRIVAGGTIRPPSQPSSFLLARYLPNGTPDATLGGSGIVSATLPGGNAISWDMVIQPDGKVVLAGYEISSVGSNTDFALARFRSDGSLDTSFGVNGIVTQSLGTRNYGYAVGLQSDGKLVLGGKAGNAGCLFRYNPDGSVDNSFGTVTSTNYVTMVVPGFTSSSFIELAMQADDGIVAATRMSGGASTAPVGIAGFDRDGRPNPLFGPVGVITASNGSHLGSSYALLVQPDRKVVLAGYIDQDDTEGYEIDLALWRFIPQARMYLPMVTR